MIGRSHRVSARQFKEIMEKGSAFHSPFFLARVAVKAPGSEASRGAARAAAIAPVKNFKTAAARVTMRRRTYAALQAYIPHLKPGASVLLFAKLPATQATVAILSADLASLFAKAHVLR